jgi:Kef-type K+ transport system membrane component KefB
MHWLGNVPLPPLDEHSLLVFWCQVLIVLTLARAGGYLLRLLGQPRVIGELLAGVLIGPSVFGQVWSGGFDWLFPASQRQAGLLLGLAWIGIVFLLGITGAEVDVSMIRRQSRAATTTTLGSLIVPLAFGAVVAGALPEDMIGSETTRAVFVSFFAVAFAISSLPVAARILGDLGLSKEPFAQLALGVATANDVVGWLLLGVVVGVAESGTFAPGSLVVTVVVVTVAAGLVVRFGPQVLDHVSLAVDRRSGGPAAEASLIALTVVGVGTITHAVGIEVVIGAFIAGIAIGGSRLGQGQGMAAITSITNGIFAPLFFAIAGIRVDLTRLGSVSVALWAVVVTLAATAAKILGSYAGGRAGRLGRRESFGLGVTLNARGALEIVIATVGLSLGVIGNTAYTIIVVMALVTTAVTGPLLKLTHGALRQADLDRPRTPSDDNR